MDSIVKLIIIFLWLPQAVAQLLNWLYWMQEKEYRFDRFGIFLKSSSGKKELQILEIVSKFWVLFLILFNNYFIYAYLLLLIILDFGVIKKKFRKRLRRPFFTQRARRIFSTGLIFVLLTFFGLFFSDLNVVRVFVFGEMYLILSLIIGVLWTIPIVNHIKKKEIDKAKKRLSDVEPMVVGITGSYGKGTTKEFLAQFLSQKYKVEKTKGSENTEFGIARRAQKLKKGTEIFIVEMGAYKKGEITKLCEIVKPELAIVTGIEPQHLELFGSLENIKKAKFELIEALPEKAVAVFNLNNKGCRELASKAKKLSTELKVIGCCVEKGGLEKYQKYGKDSRLSLVARILSANPEEVNFQVYYNGQSRKISALVHGVHFVENLAVAILVARKLKVPWKKIQKACRKLKLPKKTMQVYKVGKCTIIDDSFNSTPSGFEAALNYLSLYKKKRKIVVTSGIIELGSKSYEVHKKLGSLMGKFVDEVILTNSDFETGISGGLGDKTDKLKIIKKSSDLKKEISELLIKDCVILIEGRMPSVLFDLLI